ncbi:MAG: DUF4388 domain-containing protein [Deltaproteobacteria bacterium]|nr:DUF4388 domain-containing protein [Deltaproteobacteria bacterium]
MSVSSALIVGCTPESGKALFAQVSVRHPGLTFVTVESPSEATRDLAQHRFDCIFVEASCALPSGRLLLDELIREHASIPLCVWGELRSPLNVPKTRGAVVEHVASIEDPAVDRFLHNEVLSLAKGRLSGVSLASVLQVLSMEQRTARLRVRSSLGTGELTVRNGRLIDATYRKMVGQDAAMVLLAWADADVVFDRVAPGAIERIATPLDFLLLEAMRIHDEQRQTETEVGLDRPRASMGSTSSWLIPAMLKGDGTALVREIAGLLGLQFAALVDTELRVVVASHAAVGVHVQDVQQHASGAMQWARECLDGSSLRNFPEDVMLTTSDHFVFVRPVPKSTALAVLAIFDTQRTTLGLARVRLGQLVDSFIPSATDSR